MLGAFFLERTEENCIWTENTTDNGLSLIQAIARSAGDIHRVYEVISQQNEYTENLEKSLQ